MTARQVLAGLGLGSVLWFFGALFMAVVAEAALPGRAASVREPASAALFPIAMLSALVLVHQGRLAPLARFTAVVAAGGVGWFAAAALLGAVLVGSGMTPDTFRRFQPPLNAGLLVLALIGARAALFRWLPD
jgi:hypothetical protein